LYFLTSPIHRAGTFEHKFVPAHATKHTMGVEVELHPFFVMVPDEREWSASCRHLF